MHAKRPGEGQRLDAIEPDDQTNFLVKFASDTLGSFEASRIAAGRKMRLTYKADGGNGSRVSMANCSSAPR